MSHRHDTNPLTIEQRARRRVALKTGFYTHALVYVLVNGGLFLLSMAGTWGFEVAHGPMGRIWSLPLWGWGLGLAIHGIVVFLKLQGEGMRQGMVEREIEALKRREGQ
jgi:hypothetical protein